ncbi:MAG: heparinase II/III family protein [Cyclobacteriaceae bacterium]
MFKQKRYFNLIFILSIFFSCEENSDSSTESHPSIFLVNTKTEGFASVEELRNIQKGNHQEILWNELLSKSEKDFEVPFLDPTVDFEGRSPVHLKHANVSYDMERGLSERLSRSSLLYAVTRDDKYKDLVLHQIQVLGDTIRWPMWCDDAHTRGGPPYLDIRTCRISMAIALAYNWMYNDLTSEEKTFIVDLIDRRAIQPFWEKIKQKPGWYTHRHNWFTNIYGGMAITAMALGKDHPDTDKLLEEIVPEMIDFNKSFGELGEFNEPPGYSGAVRFSFEFAEAYRYYTDNSRNLLKEKPFPQACYWILNHTLPPGRLTAFGDTNADKGMSSPAIMAAAANANQDGVLQSYYLNYFESMQSTLELLWFNPNLEATSPNGRLPLGVAYQEHGADLISRTSWDYDITDCVVYGKAGRETNHDDNDVGQLLIDGFGERLIIDSGKPNPIYPKDYFGKDQYNYYSRSSKGHNVLVIGKREMVSEPNEMARGKILKTWFNDSIGSFWKLDLTSVYDNAKKVTRSIAHLFPGIVLVHDYAEMPKKDSIMLRWHTIETPNINDSGEFSVVKNQALLQARVLALDGKELTFDSGHQEFKPPYNLTRQGDPLVQNYEPFVEIKTFGKSASILSLFSVSESATEASGWKKAESGWSINVGGEKYSVIINGNSFELYSDGSKRKIALN